MQLLVDGGPAGPDRSNLVLEGGTRVVMVLPGSGAAGDVRCGVQ